MVAINEINIDHVSLSVFPNPANEYITLNCSANTILPVEVLNLMGEVILKGELQQTLNINTSTFSQGIYLIRVFNKTIKIVITH